MVITEWRTQINAGGGDPALERNATIRTSHNPNLTWDDLSPGKLTGYISKTCHTDTFPYWHYMMQKKSDNRPTTFVIQYKNPITAVWTDYNRQTINTDRNVLYWIQMKSIYCRTPVRTPIYIEQLHKFNTRNRARSTYIPNSVYQNKRAQANPS